MFQKNKMKNFPQRSALSVALLALAISANAATVKVKVKLSDGSPAIGATVQYVTSQFYALGTTDANGEIINTNVPNNINYKLRIVYNNTTLNTTTPVNSGGAASITTNEFNTSKLTVTAKSCATPVKDVAISFVGNGGSYYSLGFTDINGTVTTEVFGKDSLKVRALSKGTYNDNYVTTFPANSNVDLQLDKVTLAGSYLLASGSWYTANGIYVFPGKYKIRMMNNALLEDSVEVNQCTVGKYPLIVRLVDSKSNPLEGATVSYYYNGWKSMNNTNANGYSITLVDADPINITTAVNYIGATQQKTGTVANVAKYQTRNFTVNFKNSTGAPLEADAVSYYANGWKTFNGTTNGVAKMELLPYAYSMTVGYKGGSQQKSCTAADSVMNWNTQSVTLEVKDCSGTPLIAETPSYYANGWKPFGDNNTWTMEMIPYNYTFSANLNGSGTQKSIPVVQANSTITLWAGELLIGQVAPFSTASYYANGWKSINITNPNRVAINLFAGNYTVNVNGVQSVKTVTPCAADAPLAMKQQGGGSHTAETFTSVKVYPNPIVNEVNVEVPYDGNVVIYTIDGKKALSQAITAGKTSIDVSNLHTGNYLMVVQYADFTETIKIVK